MRCPPADCTASAIPKSAMIACPSCRRMFSGLMSRWITPLSVRVVERARHFPRNAHRLGDRQVPLAVEACAERLAGDERHHVIPQAVRRARVEQRQDVRMLQARRGADLAQEALTADRGAEIGVEHLDRDIAIVLEVVGEIHGRHAALPKFALEAVAVR